MHSTFSTTSITLISVKSSQFRRRATKYTDFASHTLVRAAVLLQVNFILPLTHQYFYAGLFRMNFMKASGGFIHTGLGNTANAAITGHDIIAQEVGAVDCRFDDGSLRWLSDGDTDWLCCAHSRAKYRLLGRHI